MAAIRFNDLLKRAHGAISQLRGAGPNFFLGKNGEVVYSKNNVCVHEGSGGETAEEEPVHTPGYLTIHCSEDEQLGITLILQWLPNTLLEKTPNSIRCVSPRRANDEGGSGASGVARLSCSNRSHTMDSEEEIGNNTAGSETREPPRVMPPLDNQAPAELNGGEGAQKVKQQGRPQTLLGSGEGLSIPSINLIPNTPLEQQQELLEEMEEKQKKTTGSSDTHSEPTSGEDGEEEEEDDEERRRGKRKKRRDRDEQDQQAESSSSSAEDEDEQQDDQSRVSLAKSCAAASLAMGAAIPEQFAREHNLMLNSSNAEGMEGEEPEEEAGGEEEATGNRQRPGGQQKREREQNRPGGGGMCSLFSVNLGKMRSMRVFYSDPERTSGQLVLASPDSQYKIFHFHHTGLDKLTQLVERWNAVKSKSAVGNDSPSSIGQTRQLVFCPGAETELAKAELDPEDGLYERLGWDMWRSYVSSDGSVEDCYTIRKTIYFSSMDPGLRKELWPFLLRIYPWSASQEQRDAMRNDMFLRYQRLKGRQIRRMMGARGAAGGERMGRLEGSIVKDVVRTDRRNSFFSGDENSNLDTMKSILLTYAIKHPDIGYIQGMSDLLAPLLCTLRDEPLAYWCFVQLMEQTLFCQPPPPDHSPSPSSSASDRSPLDTQLGLLRELLRLFVPAFHAHLLRLGGDAPAMMFVYRWILLFFKREFPARDALHIWEACWARYRTRHFHLFIACAIISIYGPDVVAQQLPHDEILLYFSSLAMHMDAQLILRKARGLLYQFYRLPRIPCTLAGLCSHSADSEQWSSHIEPHGQFECTQKHAPEGAQCPFAAD